MILETYKSDYKVFHAEYNYVFNSYYETIGKRVLRTNRGNLTRPSVDEVYQYRSFINDQILDYLDSLNYLDSTLATVLELGLQHEQQHQELLLYDIKYILGTNPLFPAYLPPSKLNIEETKESQINFLDVTSGLYPIGHQDDTFCFDNELGRHQVYLHGYQISDRLVTNQEYLDFMDAGGYQNFRYWYLEAWEWIKAKGRTAPFHWHNIEGIWYNYTLNGLEKIKPNEPVSHINQFEASAYAFWKDMRLPTEFEWEIASNLYQPTAHKNANFVEQQNYRPLPSQNGNTQMLGDLWEWTNSSYAPYPYFKTVEGAVGEYNGKFMINQMVLRGGSYATPQDHIRNTYRNFFHPHLNWHFTGIRLAKHV